MIRTTELLENELQDWIENTIGAEITRDQFIILFNKLNKYCDVIIENETKKGK